MELIDYLSKHFLTKNELLEQTKVSYDEFHQFQTQSMMPMASYRLKLTIESDSFFGLHNEEQFLEFYAKGYVSWLTLLTQLSTPNEAFSIFSARYKKAIKELTAKPELNEQQLYKLEKAVNLLDTTSSLFAPHERLKSSRHRLVDEVRRQYKLNK